MSAKKTVPARASAPISPMAEAFRAFMGSVLRPIPDLPPDDAIDPAERLIYVWVNGKVHADYKARGIFPEVTLTEVSRRGDSGQARARVLTSVARAMLADAIANIEREKAQGNKRATMWSWLRQRLHYELEIRHV